MNLIFSALYLANILDLIHNLSCKVLYLTNILELIHNSWAKTIYQLQIRKIAASYTYCNATINKETRGSFIQGYVIKSPP